MNRNRYIHVTQELDVADAFNEQSSVFDQLYSNNTIIRYKRNRVREHVLQFIAPRSYILELNAGTGEDAVYFANAGHKIHATDISEGMLDILVKKVSRHKLEHKISTELCSFTELENLGNKGPYDLIFSNFAGLNCSRELDKVLQSFDSLLKPGGIVTLVMLPKFCLWETLLVFRGKFKTAFRRLFSRKGANSHIEGKYFKCWYYNPQFIIDSLEKSFSVLKTEALCVVVPPSYIEHFAERYPKVYRFLVNKENLIKEKWPWKLIGDYYIISLRKNS